jgi:predicted ATP-grasp superfamily ATP-dependent carboligase
MTPDPREDAAAFVAAVADRLRGDERTTVVVPGNEGSLRAISEHRHLLEGRCLLGLPPHDVVLTALNKVEMLRAAAGSGLPPPPSIVCSTVEDGVRAAEDLGLPVMIKPSASLLRNDRGMRGQTSLLVQNAHELDLAINTVGLPFIVQSYHGKASVLSIGAVAAGGRLRAVAVARYERTWPPGAGSASFAETIEPPPELIPAVERFLADVGWEGMIELELLDDGHRRWSIDCNPRMYGSIALAIAAGANLPAMWCDHLRGMAGGAMVVAAPGHRYRFEAAEVKNLLLRLKTHRWREAALVALPRRHVVHSVFDARDPRPFVADLIRRRRKAASASRSALVLRADR